MDSLRTKSNVRISVVIPCYNGMPYLPQAIDSVLAQTLPPVELIVVDDGSKDDSAAFVGQYAGQHPQLHIRLIQQANSGEPAARNAGILAAAGEWVAMLDTDDWWEPSKLQQQVAALNQAGDECVLVHTGVTHHFPDGRVQPCDLIAPGRRVGWCTRALLEPSSIGHPSILIRKTALEKIGGYDVSFRQACDIDLYFRLSAVGTFAFVPEHLLHYRIHAGQMSASQIDQIPFHHRAIRRFFAEHPEIESKIGREPISDAMAQHVAAKLQSLYWRRDLASFRKLLRYAAEQHLSGACIDPWKRKARWPDWLIRLWDRWDSGKPQRLKAG